MDKLELDFKLDFTGKAIVVAETNHGPIEFSINDLDVVVNLVRLLLDKSERHMRVDAFSDEEATTMKTMLERIASNDN